MEKVIYELTEESQSSFLYKLWAKQGEIINWINKEEEKRNNKEQVERVLEVTLGEKVNQIIDKWESSKSILYLDNLISGENENSYPQVSKYQALELYEHIIKELDMKGTYMIINFPDGYGFDNGSGGGLLFGCRKELAKELIENKKFRPYLDIIFDQ